MSSDSTLQKSWIQLALASEEPQHSASAETGTTTGPASGQVAAGWNPSEVWLRRIEQPRRSLAERRLIRGLP